MRYLAIMTILSFFISLPLIGQVIRIEVKNENPSIKTSAKEGEVQVLTFENGLTVYLREDFSQSDVLGAMVVKGGSKFDPKDATGTAHYFEHMMFKGSKTLGTLDYELEKPYLDSIKMMYDLIRLDRDNVEFRNALLSKIDSFSVIAGQYAIPNDFSKVLSAIGGTGINAYTTYENIVYHNRFPAQSITQWAELYRDRFENPVFRLFQSELETVYEEKNRSMDNMIRQAFEELYRQFYPDNIYGKQTVLGSVEDLKSPSISAIESYWKRYYSAPNMALVLIGNFHSSSVIPILEKSFGQLRNGDIETMPVANVAPFNGREVVKKKLTPIPIGVMGFRGVPTGHKDELALEMAVRILTNESNTGLIDSLVLAGDMMEAQVIMDNHYDVGGIFMLFVPKPIIQSVGGVEKDILSQLQNLKKGNFSLDLFEATKQSMLKEEILDLENSDNQLSKIIDSYMLGVDVNAFFDNKSDIRDIKMIDVIRVSNTYFGNDYLLFQSKVGSVKKEKLQKPKITPIIPTKKDAESIMAHKIMNMDSQEIMPNFIDFESSVFVEPIRNNLIFYGVENPVNEVFNLTLKIGVGLYKIPSLAQLAFYMSNSGAGNQNYTEVESVLQHMGTKIDFSVDESFFTISMTGFDDKFEVSLLALSKLIAKPNADFKALKKRMLNEEKLMVRFMKNDATNLAEMVEEYALYGSNSSFLHRNGKKEIKAIEEAEILKLLNDLFQYESHIHYVGNMNFKQVKALVNKTFPFQSNLVKSPLIVDKPLQPIQSNRLIFLQNKNSLQSQIRINLHSAPMNGDERNYVGAFNNFYGLGMNSVLFREAREFRSLAYSAYGYFDLPYNFNNSTVLRTSIGTQADKTIDALDLIMDLQTEMTINTEQIPYLKAYLLNSINSGFPNFRYHSRAVQFWKNQGYKSDPRQEYYAVFRKLTADDLIRFYDSKVARRPSVVSLIGDDKRFDLEALKKTYEFKTLKLKDVFYY